MLGKHFNQKQTVKNKVHEKSLLKIILRRKLPCHNQVIIINLAESVKVCFLQ